MAEIYHLLLNTRKTFHHAALQNTKLDIDHFLDDTHISNSTKELIKVGCAKALKFCAVFIKLYV